MKKLLRIFNSGWFLLLAMAVLIIGGRTKSGGMLWSGTVLLLLGAAAGIRDCIRRLRALRHKIRQRPGMEDAGFWSAIREEIREETKAARTAAETARTAGIPDPETAPEETEITAQTEAPQTTARETATSQMQDNAASPEESETKGTAKG